MKPDCKRQNGKFVQVWSYVTNFVVARVASVFFQGRFTYHSIVFAVFIIADIIFLLDFLTLSLPNICWLISPFFIL